MDDIEVLDAAGDGVRVQLSAVQLSESRLSGVRVSGAGGDGLLVQGTTAATFDRISIANCDGDGVAVTAGSRNAFLIDLMVSNNGGTGIALSGNNHVLTLATSANNAGDGVRVEGTHTLLMHTTAANNGSFGIEVGSAARNVEIINSVSTNNLGGLSLAEGSQRSLVHDVWLAGNVTSDVLVEGDYNVFSGELAVGGTDACALAGSPTEPGLMTNPCAASTATVTFDNSLQTTDEPDDGIFGGRQLESDPENGGTVDSAGHIAHGAITDWLNFSHYQRHWGRPPSSGSFPNTAAIGRCDAASGCAYWDWRVSPQPSRVRDALGTDGVLLGALEQPIHVRSHLWSATSEGECRSILEEVWDEAVCATPLLAYAFEPIDGFDNDNGLCEPGETCFLNRNRGAYPGGEHPDPHRRVSYEGDSSIVRLDPGVDNEFVDLPNFIDVRLWSYIANGD